MRMFAAAPDPEEAATMSPTPEPLAEVIKGKS